MPNTNNLRVITAPLAIIKVGGVAVGKMRNIRITETIRRGKVIGLGNLTPDELPALEWSGSMNAGFFNIDFRLSQIPGAIQRIAQNVTQWADTVLLQEDGVQVDIMKKVRDSVNPKTGIITSKLEVYASIKGCFLSREGFDISEGQISGRDTDFEYTTPIIFPI